MITDLLTQKARETKSARPKHLVLCTKGLYSLSNAVFAGVRIGIRIRVNVYIPVRTPVLNVPEDLRRPYICTLRMLFELACDEAGNFSRRNNFLRHEVAPNVSGILA